MSFGRETSWASTARHRPRSLRSSMKGEVSGATSDRQPKPPALVLNEPNCYHFRVLDPRVFSILSATRAAVTIGGCYHI